MAAVTVACTVTISLAIACLAVARLAVIRTAITPMANRIIKVKNGKISENYINEKPISIDDIEW
jgi:hypothetical protein